MTIDMSQANKDLFKTATFNGKTGKLVFDKKAMNDYLEKTERNTWNLYAEIVKKNQEAAEKQKKKSSKKFGAVSLSNTDSVQRCQAVKAKLKAKLAEIFSSDIDAKIKGALAREVSMAIDRVDQKISEIKRREVALWEEKAAKKNESEHTKRKRRDDLRKRYTTVKKEFLYSAGEGGLDPAEYGGGAGAAASVAFDIGGVSGTVSDIAVATVASADISTADASVSANVSAAVDTVV